LNVSATDGAGFFGSAGHAGYSCDGGPAASAKINKA
jgi:hypothetical protein